MAATGPRGAAARLADVPADRAARHRSRRCVGHGLLVGGDRRATATTCSRSSTPSATGRPPCRRCSARATSPASGGARSSPPGTGDNMAGALGVGLRSGDVAVSIGTSGTVYSVCDDAGRRSVGHRRRVRRRHRPPPPARVHAQRDEGHRGRATAARRRPRRVRRDGPRRPAGRRRPRRCCRTSTASGRPTGPTATGVLGGDAQRRRPRAARPGRRRGCRVRAARRARRAGRVRPRRRPADPRRRWRPIARLPPGARRPQRAGRARAARRRAGRHRRVRAGGRRGGRGRAGRCRRSVAARRRRRRRAGPGATAARRGPRRVRDAAGRDGERHRSRALGGARVRLDRHPQGHPGDAAVGALRRDRHRVAGRARGRPPPPPSSGSPAPTAPTTSCSPTPTSRRCTSRCPTTSTPSGRSAPRPPASTCCARSRWR